MLAGGSKQPVQLVTLRKYCGAGLKRVDWRPPFEVASAPGMAVSAGEREWNVAVSSMLSVGLGHGVSEAVSADPHPPVIINRLSQLTPHLTPAS